MSTSGNSSVSVWMHQLMAGDVDKAVEKLWERYYHRLVGLARVKLSQLPRRVADEEDVALSAFNSFYQGAVAGRFPSLNDRDNLWRLLVTITARKACRLHEQLNCQKRKGDLDQAALQGASDDSLQLDQFLAKDPSPEFAAQAAEEYQALLALLPNDETRSIAQWKMEGFTTEEIAAKLGCVPRSVQRKLGLIRTLWSDK